MAMMGGAGSEGPDEEEEEFEESEEEPGVWKGGEDTASEVLVKPGESSGRSLSRRTGAGWAAATVMASGLQRSKMATWYEGKRSSQERGDQRQQKIHPKRCRQMTKSVEDLSESRLQVYPPSAPRGQDNRPNYMCQPEHQPARSLSLRLTCLAATRTYTLPHVTPAASNTLHCISSPSHRHGKPRQKLSQGDCGYLPRDPAQSNSGPDVIPADLTVAGHEQRNNLRRQVDQGSKGQRTR